MKPTPEISFVIPLFNEEENFELLIKRLEELRKTLSLESEVVLIDDGSKDKTAMLMNNLALSNDAYLCVFLSKNHGHQLALSAGLSVARAKKAIMILDGDLQDPPEMIHNFLVELNNGYDVVYGIRKQRKEGLLKKMAYWTYYRIMKSIAHIDLPLDSGDFALISRKVADYMNNMPEQNRYLRGMRTWIGFKQIGIEYSRDARHAGTTKYSWKKLFELANSGIYNFSDIPVKVITRLGITAIAIALIYLAYTLFQKIFYNNVPTGFTALIFAIVMFSGVQLISLGIIGEYVLRIYRQAQNRPLFIIDKVISDKQVKDGQELLR
ncbi:MAG: glycosyltransferase family 2 protein [Bacteroidia bacterium]